MHPLTDYYLNGLFQVNEKQLKKKMPAINYTVTNESTDFTVSDCEIRSESLSYILSRYDMNNILHLRVEETNITIIGLFPLKMSKFRSLKKLTLIGNLLNSDLARIFLLSGILYFIQINLQENLIGDRFFAKLSGCKLENLKLLNVSANCIGNRGVENLLKINLPSLTFLNCSRNRFTYSSSKLFAKNQWFCLQKLVLTYSLLTDDFLIYYYGHCNPKLMNLFIFEDFMHIVYFFHCSTLSNLKRLIKCEGPIINVKVNLKYCEILHLYEKEHILNAKIIEAIKDKVCLIHS